MERKKKQNRLTIVNMNMNDNNNDFMRFLIVYFCARHFFCVTRQKCGRQEIKRHYQISKEKWEEEKNRKEDTNVILFGELRQNYM